MTSATRRGRSPEGRAEVRRELVAAAVRLFRENGYDSTTVDDIATRDWPAAIDTVRRETGADSVQALAHCVGGLSLFMALGAGLVALAWWKLGDAWRRWWLLNKAFRKERDLVKRLRIQTPNEPCVWGHVCQAAQSADGDGVNCPRFGPGAPDEVERVPREL